MLDSSSLQQFRRAVTSRLAVLRSQAGLSQTALAAELGVDQSLVSRVEAGTRDLGLDEAFAWGEVLGLTSEETATLLSAAWEAHAARPEGYWK